MIHCYKEETRQAQGPGLIQKTILQARHFISVFKISSQLLSLDIQVQGQVSDIAYSGFVKSTDL